MTTRVISILYCSNSHFIIFLKLYLLKNQGNYISSGNYEPRSLYPYFYFKKPLLANTYTQSIRLLFYNPLSDH